MFTLQSNDMFYFLHGKYNIWALCSIFLLLKFIASVSKDLWRYINLVLLLLLLVIYMFLFLLLVLSPELGFPRMDISGVDPVWLFVISYQLILTSFIHALSSLFYHSEYAFD